METMEQRVNARLGYMLYGAEYMESEEGAALARLRDVYRVLSGEEPDACLPRDVVQGLPLLYNLAGPWRIFHRGATALCVLHPLSIAVPADDVRSAVDAVARRILQPADDGYIERLRQAIVSAGRPLAGAEASPVECIDAVRRATGDPFGAPPTQVSRPVMRDDDRVRVADLAPARSSPQGWTMGEIVTVAVKCDLIAAACERARLFLADLDYLSVAESREAALLRHRLRDEPCEAALRAAVALLSGIHPAQPGQREVVEELMEACQPVQPGEWYGRRSPSSEAVAGRYISWAQIAELAAYK